MPDVACGKVRPSTPDSCIFSAIIDDCCASRPSARPTAEATLTRLENAADEERRFMRELRSTEVFD